MILWILIGFCLDFIWKNFNYSFGMDFCGDRWIFWLDLVFDGGVWSRGEWGFFLGVYRSQYRSGFWDFWCGVCDEYLGMIWCVSCAITM